MLASTFLRLLDEAKKQTILVVGDIILDHYVYGNLRTDENHHVPLLEHQAEDFALGGAGHVAAQLAALGCEVTLAGNTGDATHLSRLCFSNRIEFYPTRINQTTPEKIRLITGDRYVARWDIGSYSNTCPQIPEIKSNCVVISSHGDVIFPDFRSPVVADYKNPTWESYRRAWCCTPTEQELTKLCGSSLKESTSILRFKSYCPYIVVTRGRDGILLDREGKYYHTQSGKFPVDPLGAGDVVTATMAILGPTQEGVELANFLAALSTEFIGTFPLTKSEIAKRLTSEDIVEQVKLWKLAREKVIFTNGCFDILHEGHISFLEKARSQGNRLIIGLNSDESIRRLKGSQRPTISEKERARILRSFADRVVIFHEDTPERLVEEIRPDMIVKGIDWLDKPIPGSKFAPTTCLNSGSQVTTTKLLEKLHG